MITEEMKSTLLDIEINNPERDYLNHYNDIRLICNEL